MAAEFGNKVETVVAQRDYLLKKATYDGEIRTV